MMLKISKKEKETGKRIYRKFLEMKKKSRMPLISLRELYRILNKEEGILIKKIVSVDAKDYGKKEIFYGITAVPKNIIAIKDQKYFSVEDKKFKKVAIEYLPATVFSAFKMMKEAMGKELGTSINVTSGYRSSAYQVVILFIVLFENKWNMFKTLRRVALPGCSEHGYPLRQAVDVAPEIGIKRLENFYKTKEYKWLLKNARRFGFYLSFPSGNKSGVMFEPWHWRYVKR
jgi:LAS superfamily LD-carboxypeptidase LdcB